MNLIFKKVNINDSNIDNSKIFHNNYETEICR